MTSVPHVGTPRGIRIETPASDYTGYSRRYWLNYRYAPWSTGLNWLRNGLQIDVCQTSYGSDGAIQLDVTPYSRDDNAGASWTDDNIDKMDGALIIGRTYSDTTAGIHITPIATGSNGTNEEYIDFVVNLGSFSANSGPVINAFTATTNQVSTGQTINFNVSASDPDGDVLAYAWDFDQVQIWTASGLNSPAAAKSWSSPGQYRVQVTVSDRKGGVTTESLVVTVGAPANVAQIWGRVLWAGYPVVGARVWTTAGQAWTDSDGSYVLTDLSSASNYFVNCAAAGHVFTPQFANPVSLAAGSAYGIDFYANEALAGGNGTTFAISGQVTDGGSGVAGVEVRGGGMLTITDGGGNYELPNLIAGTYTVRPRNNNWTFSPVSRSVSINSADSTGNNFSRVAPYSISGRVNGPPAASQSPAPTIYLSDGSSVQATRQGSGPNRYWGYTLSNVPAGQYSLTAQLSGYSFGPATFTNPLTISGTLTGIDFDGTAASIAGAIAGRITQQGVPVPGVTVQAQQSGSTVSTATSDSDGYYRIANLATGAYTVVPSQNRVFFHTLIVEC